MPKGTGLAQDLQQFNDFFIEKEEECIIRTQALEEQLSKTDKSDIALLGRLRSAFVDLHGEKAAGLIEEITLNAMCRELQHIAPGMLHDVQLPVRRRNGAAFALEPLELCRGCEDPKEAW